jgi:hypothetical protein
MRSRLVSCILIGVLATSLTAIVANADDRGERDREAATYDVRAERTFEGFIIGKEYVLDGLVYVTVKTADALLEVQIASKESIVCSKFRLNSGDLVIVVGVSVALNKHRIVLGRVISGMNGTFFLRDDRGARYKTPIRSDMIR